MIPNDCIGIIASYIDDAVTFNKLKLSKHVYNYLKLGEYYNNIIWKFDRDFIPLFYKNIIRYIEYESYIDIKSLTNCVYNKKIEFINTYIVNDEFFVFDFNKSKHKRIKIICNSDNNFIVHNIGSDCTIEFNLTNKKYKFIETTQNISDYLKTLYFMNISS